MARKKDMQATATPVESTKPVKAGSRPKGRPPLENPKPPLSVLVTLRGTSEYAAWLDYIAEQLGKKIGVKQVDRTLVIDRAMTELAKMLEADEPPARY